MVLKCKKCGKKYKSKTGYEKHIKNPNCDKVFQCLTCDNIFKSQWHLTRHINERVTTCLNNSEDTDDSIMICECGSSFTTKSNLTRHQKKCNFKSRDDILMDMVAKLTQEVSNLKGNTTIINNNIHNDNSQTINYQTVVLRPYGQEDLEKLDINAVRNLLMNNKEKYMPLMIEMIHANPEILENHNIFYNTDTEEIMVYTDEQEWKPKPLHETKTELSYKSKRYLTSHPLAQNIPRGSLAEKTYSDNMKFILDQPVDNIDCHSVLTIVSKNDGFMEMVEAMSNVISPRI
jgi:uncharacterized C2H2 Zn-finger protein